MRKLILLLAFAFWAFTLSLMLSEDANAQKKNATVSEVQTASPVFYFIHEGEEGDGAVELQIHDRQHQFTSMGYDRLSDQAKGNDPKNPLIKLVQMPDIGPLAFRQVESLEEARAAPDGVTVITVRLNALRAAARVIY